MKSEVIVIFALAAALTFHRGPGGSACGPSGCLLLDFQKNVEALRMKEITSPAGNESASRVGSR